MTRKKDKRGKVAAATPRVHGARRAAVLTSAAVIIVVGIGAYWSSLGGKFFLDDYGAIVTNADIRRGDSLWTALLPSESSPDSPRWRGPVVTMTFAVNYALGELDPRGYHLLNVAVHILAALLLFGVIRRTLLLDGLEGRFGASSHGLALACTLVWMVHPLLTDSVTYVLQRTVLSMGLFYLATLYCVIRGCQSRRKRRWFAAAVVCSFLGMLSKEVMATAPVMIFLFDRVFIAASFREVVRKRWLLYVGLAASWGALVWLMVTSPHHETIGFNLGIRSTEYAAAQCRIIVRYLGLAFWPVGLLLDYGSARPVSFGEVIRPAAVLALLVVATLVALRRQPPLGFMGVWFFVILLPTSSVVPIITEVGAERRMYLPLVAVVVLVIVGGNGLLELLVNRKLLSPSRRRWTARVVVGLLVCVLGARTIARNFDYHDEVGMWKDVIAKNPSNARAYDHLGVALSRAGRRDDEVGMWKDVIAKDPSTPPYDHLGVALGRAGRLDGAIAAYQQALALDPTLGAARANLAKALAKAGRYREAVAEYIRALKAEPGSVNLRHSLGVALDAVGRTDEAVREYRRVLESEPNHTNAHFNLARALTKLGHYQSAVESFRQVLQMNPGDVEAAFGLARALALAGELDQAVPAYRQVVRLSPRHFAAHHNLGRILQRQGKASDAIEAYRAALALKPDHAPTQAALARLLKQAQSQ